MGDMETYAIATRQTAVYPESLSGSLDAITYVVLGLCGEAGEFANLYKKVLRDDDGDITKDREAKLKDELGDVMWYVARISDEMNWDLDAICHDNMVKLLSRKNRDALHGEGGDR